MDVMTCLIVPYLMSFGSLWYSMKKQRLILTEQHERHKLQLNRVAREMHSHQRHPGYRHQQRREYTPSRSAARPLSGDGGSKDGKDDSNDGTIRSPEPSGVHGGVQGTVQGGGHRSQAQGTERKHDLADASAAGSSSEAPMSNHGSAGTERSAESKGTASTGTPLIGRMNNIMTGLMASYRTKQDDEP